jgi:hypothetical protein
MSELERALTALAAEVEWPPTPAFDLRLEPARRPRRRWPVVAVALGTAALAVALAFAVPQSRGALLRFLHLGGVTVERVTTLPPAAERPLAAGLGAPVTPTDAEAVLGGPVALPRTSGEPQLYASAGVVSTVLATPEPVLLSELRSDDGGTLLKKLAGISTTVEWVPIDASTQGLWIAGEHHVVYWLQAPPRLAGNVLVWERDGVTYRLEGKRLTKARALELARELEG